jgi:hypothetical protein
MFAQRFPAIVLRLGWRVDPSDLIAAERFQSVERLQFPIREAEFGVEDAEEEGDDCVAFSHISCQQVSRRLLSQHVWSWKALCDPQHIILGDIIKLVAVTSALRVNNAGSEAFVSKVRPLLHEVVLVLLGGGEVEDVLAERGERLHP